jgi:transglutaminase-like putative cysteine protease
MKTRTWTFSAAALLPCLALASPITQLEASSSYTLNRDATYVEENFARIRVDEQAGIRSAGQIPVRFSTSLHTIEILEAFTTTKDGQRLDVTPDKILEQQLPQSSGAPMFSDHKLKMVVFPQVEIGSIVTLRYRRVHLKPTFPGLFNLWESRPGTIDTEKTTVSLTAPAELELHVDTREASGGEQEKPAPGQRKWVWAFADAKGKPAEPRQVSGRDTGPYVMVSTYSSYDELAKQYALRAADRERPSPEIRKLADEITTGIRDKRAQAAALYEWVNRNIRYVSISLELGGVVPHDAEEIRAARYGDCKDHATLLKALLTARKIRSSAVLVHAGDAFVVPDTVMSGAFNHAITYLPDFDLFVDSTPGILPFGVLPPSESGKRALVVDLGNGKPGFRTLPLPSPKTDWLESRGEFTIAEDGTITGTMKTRSHGVHEAGERQAMKNIPKGELPRLAERMLGGAGTHTMEVGDPLDFAKPFELSGTVRLPTYLKVPGPGAISLPSGLNRFNPTIPQFVQLTTMQDRTSPFGCPTPGRSTDVWTLTLPATIKITALPRDVAITNKFGSYGTSYAQAGNTLTRTRTLVLEYPGAVCGVADYPEMRAMAMKIAQDLRAPIAYE